MMRLMQTGLYLCLRMFDSLLFLLSFFILEHFITFSVVITLGFILLCFPGPSETVRGSNFYFSWLILLLCFTLCPFVTKRGSNFYFGPGMYFQTVQVIFVPEWPKGEFVSILASFCVWTKSLKCKDAVNRDSTIQSDIRRFCLQVKRISSSLSAVQTIEPSRPDANLSTVPSVRMTCLPSRPPRQISIIRPDEVFIPSGGLAARPNASQYSISFIFLSKFQEREDRSTVRTMWYPVQTRVSLRQESQFEYHRLDV